MLQRPADGDRRMLIDLIQFDSLAYTGFQEAYVDRSKNTRVMSVACRETGQIHGTAE